MGGYGSGPKGRGRATVEATRSLDILRFKREGMLASGAWLWRWTRAEDGSVIASVNVATAVEADRTEIFLSYSATQEGSTSGSMSYSVGVERTTCYYGGTRPWFRCPNASCGRRSRFLYQRGRFFLCRLCANLTYSSRQIHRDEMGESNWMEDRRNKLYARMDRARSAHKRARLEAMIAALDRRETAIWRSIGARFGIRP